MPQASKELRAKFPGGDKEAVDFLEKNGFVLSREWTWSHPEANRSPRDSEWDAIDYLHDEWDYGGFTS